MEVIIGIVIICVLYIIFEHNHLVHLRNKVKQAKSSIDVYLLQRFDLIPNLVECVKAYAVHEETVFNEITRNRSRYMETKSIKDGEILNNQCNNLLMMGESYPGLKSDEHFLNLQKSLSKMESQLQAARRIYNVEVTNYNTRVCTFPSGLIASLFGFTEAEFFEIAEMQRQNIEVDM